MRKTRRGYVAVSLVLLSAVACGSGDSPTPTAEPPTTAATIPPTTVDVKPAVVLDAPGAQPRQPLTLRLTAGSTAKVAMVNKLTMNMTLDGQPVPTGVVPGTRMVMEERIDSVDANGTARFSITFLDITVVPTPGAGPDVVKATQAAINGLKGVKGGGVVDARGQVTDVIFDTRSVADPSLKTTLDSMVPQIGNLSVPFPAEPVGVGARWTVKGASTVSGIPMTTTTRVTLRSRTGDRYELDVAQDAAGIPGPASFPDMPAGASASITSFNVRSTGQTSGDLTRRQPLRSSSKGTGDGHLEMSVGAQKLRLVQQLTIDISMSAP